MAARFRGVVQMARAVAGQEDRIRADQATKIQRAFLKARSRRQEPEEVMDVAVVGMAGDVIMTVSVDAAGTVRTLKLKIEKDLGTLVNNQNLFVEQRPLSDDSKLRDIFLQAEPVVMLVRVDKGRDIREAHAATTIADVWRRRRRR
eukprot:TRINITY_DN98698_c0_g1_i1.p1 TRINITY_DN98698_c0_g1~~TRINITY_DN98698_c0_g1_i1.p1  ORF type:complete len:164 (+),score=19.65 TRINITY_DN98698_c0_g1_i1:57-494(+)